MKCMLCGCSEFKIDITKREARCSGCNSTYSLDELLSINSSNGMHNNEFVIESGTLKKYLGVKTSISIPEGVTKIGESCFKDMYMLEEVKFPNTIKVIGIAAFEGCESLKTINLPYGLREIGYVAFENCKSLETLSIPDSVTEITAYFLSTITTPFLGCSSLREVRLPDRFDYRVLYGTKVYEKYAEREKREKERMQEQLERERIRKGLCPKCGEEEPLFRRKCKRCGYKFS